MAQFEGLQTSSRGSGGQNRGQIEALRNGLDRWAAGRIQNSPHNRVESHGSFKLDILNYMLTATPSQRPESNASRPVQPECKLVHDLFSCASAGCVLSSASLDPRRFCMYSATALISCGCAPSARSPSWSETSVSRPPKSQTSFMLRVSTMISSAALTSAVLSTSSWNCCIAVAV